MARPRIELQPDEAEGVAASGAREHGLGTRSLALGDRPPASSLPHALHANLIVVDEPGRAFLRRSHRFDPILGIREHDCNSTRSAAFDVTLRGSAGRCGSGRRAIRRLGTTVGVQGTGGISWKTGGRAMPMAR